MQTGPEDFNAVSNNSLQSHYPTSRDGGSSPTTPNTNLINTPENKTTSQNAPTGSSFDDANLPPAKRQKLADDTPDRTAKPKRPSPPWKKFAVEGPTAFVENGRRKSSRTNYLPVDLQHQGDARQTRSTVPAQPNATKSKYGGASLQEAASLGKSPPASHKTLIGAPHDKSRILANAKSHSIKFSQGQKPGHKRHTSSTSLHNATTKSTPNNLEIQTLSSSNSHRSSQAANRDGPNTKAKKVKSGGVKKVEPTLDMLDDASSKENYIHGIGQQSQTRAKDQPAKIRFRLRMPGSTIQHTRPPTEARKYSSFREWVEKEGSWDQASIGCVDDVHALQEARARRRVYRAVQPGGLLSEGRSHIYQLGEQDEPSRQYGHWDHLVTQAVYFRKLMEDERRRHQREAKRLAFACQERWKQLQPKSEDDWTGELKAGYKQVLKHLHQRWAVATAVVERKRVERWEDKQARLQKDKLNRLLQDQDTRLQPRLHGEDDSYSTSDVDVSTESSGASATDELNMSESDEAEQMSESADDADVDKNLSLDELREKYAEHQPVASIQSPKSEVKFDTFDEDPGALNNAPLPESSSNYQIDEDDGALGDSHQPGSTMDLDQVSDHLLDDTEESDEMDDDMGESADEASGEDESECDADDDQEESRGLLGFFSKHEYQSPQDEISSKNDVGSDAPDSSASSTRNVSEVQTPQTSSSEAPQAERQDHSALPNSNLSTTEVMVTDLDSRNAKQMDQQLFIPGSPSSTTTIKTVVPHLLRGVLREYQHHGLDWLAGLYATETNGILADEMGLGKTIQTIALLAHLALEYEVWGPHLVVVPTSVMLNWEMEFRKFLPGFKILTYYGSAEERKEKRKGWMNNDKWNVMITSYTFAAADESILKRKDWHYIILDEAHHIKNWKSQRWQKLLSYKARAKLLLTGTPLQNNLTELWALLTFLMPERITESGTEGFANLEDFLSWFRQPEKRILSGGLARMDDGDRAIVSKLHKILRPYLLRRLKADVEKQMPGKYEHREFCRLSKRQRELYDGFLERADTRATMASGNHLSIINCLMQLRKVCNHPDLFETRQIVTSYAMPRAAYADFEDTDRQVRRWLSHKELDNVDLHYLNLTFGANGPLSALETMVKERLGTLGMFRELAARQFSGCDTTISSSLSGIESTLTMLRSALRRSRYEQLTAASYHTSLRSQRRPLYNHAILALVSITDSFLPRPRASRHKKDSSDFLTSSSSFLDNMIMDLPKRAAACDVLLRHFACITPKVMIRKRRAMLSSPIVKAQIWPARTKVETDPFHHARTRLSIAFPDSRLLQYDCGKLQRLANLLRDLHSGGHRALIFTQMTKVLDLLEQFLNIHGYLYLRLDGSTKAEQRQGLTEKFNNDPRIFCFILSSRSGGIGINLTGADTVIFYDQDWNPAMDKQCQDRCHRIGQTRDVHIYRLISESTIEANILRTADSKLMLDNVVIQEGDFTTDFFQKMSVRDMLGDEGARKIGNEATAALDTSLGKSAAGRVLQVAEDQEDAVAARQAEKEITQTEEVDLKEGQGQDADGENIGRQGFTPIVAPSAWCGTAEDDIVLEEASHALYWTSAAADARVRAVAREDIEPNPTPDEYMLRFLEWEMEGVPVDGEVLARKSKKKSKKGGHHT